MRLYLNEFIDSKMTTKNLAVIALIFGIITNSFGISNSNDLFEISNEGVLSLTVGKPLDFETAEAHVLTVEVSDGQLTTTADITVTVTDVVEGAFITTWETTTDNESITIPTNATAYTYDYLIDWGDGTISTDQTGNATHTYATAGSYSVAITGIFPAIYFNNKGDKEKIKSIDQWGTIEWQSMRHAFYGCSPLGYAATDVPNLTEVTDMSYMFAYTSAFNGDLSNWKVNKAISMRGMFVFARSFNSDLSKWEINKVTIMNNMFDSSGLSITNYNATLKGWSELATVPSKITLGAKGIKYCNDGETARTALEAKDWTFMRDTKGSAEECM